MQKIILRLTILVYTLSTGFFAPAQSSDSAVIVRLLKSDYATMGNFDLKTHLANCTKDYLLIENGDISNIEQESIWYTSNAHRILTRADSFSIRAVKVFDDIAYAVYTLKSVMNENNKMTTKVWSESAVFRKQGQLWKIALIHSTPVEID